MNQLDPETETHDDGDQYGESAGEGSAAGRGLTGLPLFAVPVETRPAQAAQPVPDQQFDPAVASGPPRSPMLRRTPFEALAGRHTAPDNTPHPPPTAATVPSEPPTPTTAPEPSGRWHVQPMPRASASTAPARDGELDWVLVRALHQQVAELLVARENHRGRVEDLAARRELGRKLIIEVLSDYAREADHAGVGQISARTQERMAKAIFDEQFGLGRLQPLVDDVDLEDIEIYGYDKVVLVSADGGVRPGPRVAESDADLIETVKRFASNTADSTSRPWSSAHPDLDLTLPGDHRLAASAWITPRPTIVIRRHRLIDITLDDLVERNTLDPTMASLLRAAVRARMSIVTSGDMGSGKTTLTRALGNEVPPEESIATIESERELFLDKLTHRHPRCISFEARPGSGEVGTDGRKVGEVTMDEILIRAMRMNRSRVIVGEVRGPEVIPMFQAMQAGAGSLSTTHAHSAKATIGRLVAAAMKAGPQVTSEWAYREVHSHINLIVHIRKVDSVDPTSGQNRTRDRYIDEVIALSEGADGQTPGAITEVYKPGRDGRPFPHLLPGDLTRLEQYGFDGDTFRAQALRTKAEQHAQDQRGGL